MVAATGGSTNGGLHLPAMAHECGIEFTLRDFAEIAARTPHIADLKPGGRFVAKDMGEAGGMPMLLKTLLEGGFIHGDCMTVTGKTIAQNVKDVKWRDDQVVIRKVSEPLSPTGGVVGLWVPLAPDGAIVKVAGMTSHRSHRGTAWRERTDGIRTPRDDDEDGRRACREDGLNEVDLGTWQGEIGRVAAFTGGP